MGRLAARDCSLLRHGFLESCTTSSQTRLRFDSTRYCLSNTVNRHYGRYRRSSLQERPLRRKRPVDKDDAWDQVRLDWHAAPQMKEALRGQKLNFNIQKGGHKELSWPTHKHTEEEEVGKQPKLITKPSRRRLQGLRAMRSHQWPVDADSELRDKAGQQIREAEDGLSGPQTTLSPPESLKEAESFALLEDTQWSVLQEDAQWPQGEESSALPESTEWKSQREDPQWPQEEPAQSADQRFPWVFAGRSDLTKTVRRLRREGEDVPFIQPKRDLGVSLEKPEITRAKSSLVISGISPRVKGTDLSRLIESSLSNWQFQIKTFSQMRKASSMETMDRLQVTFHSQEAAVSYMKTLERLRQLNAYKQRTARDNPEWLKQVPQELRNPNGIDPDVELRSFTLGPWSVDSINVKRENVQEDHSAWVEILREALQLPEGADRPSLIMAELSPSLDVDVNLSLLLSSVHNEDHEWDFDAVYKIDEVAPVIHPRHRGAYDTHTLGKVRSRGRFFVVCPSEDEAQAFHRFWNSRALNGWEHRPLHGQDYIMHTSIVDW